MMSTNQPARRPPKTDVNDLRVLLTKYKDQIAMALPRHVTPERMIRVALTAFSRTPLLADCSSTSICGAIVQASILGLEPDGMSGEAFLIPYWNSKAGGYECQMQPGYKGIVKLARNTGEYSMIDAQPVHENDTFDFAKGSEVWWVHKWDPRKPRGAVYGYWAGFRLVNGGANFEYMSVEEIDAHRDQYSQGAYKRERGQKVIGADGKAILQGPWKDSPDWMYRKVPLMQALKLAPKSISLRTAMTLNEQADSGQAQSFTDLPSALACLPAADEPGQIEPPAPIAEPQSKSAGAQQPPPETATVARLNETQAKRLTQIAEESGWRPKDFDAWLKKQYGVDAAGDIRAVDYDEAVECVRAGGEVPK